MPETIILEFYEKIERTPDMTIDWDPKYYSFFENRKVAEIDATDMTIPELKKLFQLQEMLNRTHKIKRIPV